MADLSTFFEMADEASGFEQAFTKAISVLKRGGMQSMIAEENIQRFSHGKRWNHRANPHTVDGEMQTMSVEWATPFQEIVDGDLTLIPRAIQSISEQMHGAHLPVSARPFTLPVRKSSAKWVPNRWKCPLCTWVPTSASGAWPTSVAG